MQANSNWLSNISQNVANSNSTGYKEIGTVAALAEWLAFAALWSARRPAFVVDMHREAAPFDLQSVPSLAR